MAAVADLGGANDDEQRPYRAELHAAQLRSDDLPSRLGANGVELDLVVYEDRKLRLKESSIQQGIDESEKRTRRLVRLGLRAIRMASKNDIALAAELDQRRLADRCKRMLEGRVAAVGYSLPLIRSLNEDATCVRGDFLDQSPIRFTCAVGDDRGNHPQLASLDVPRVCGERAVEQLENRPRHESRSKRSSSRRSRSVCAGRSCANSRFAILGMVAR